MPQVKELASGVYAISQLQHPTRPEGVNAGFVITSGSVIFIDAGMSIDAAKFLWDEAHKHVSKGKQIYLILTHHHPDHSFGMRYLVSQGAHVIAHRETAQLFRHEGDKYRDFIQSKYCPDPEKTTTMFGEVELTPPNTSIMQDEVVIIDGEEMHLLHTPGHVMGQLSVYLPDDRILFCSDTAISGAPPDTQYSRPGGWKMWIDQLERLKDLPIEAIVPGHGDIGGAELLDDNIIYLRLALGRQNRQLYHVLKHKRYGKALDFSLRNGRTALFLAQRGFVVTGVDAQQSAGENFLREAAKEHLRVHYRCAEPIDYAFDDRFDVIIATNIFHNYSHDANLALIEHMRRFTQPKGIHLFSAFTNEVESKNTQCLFDPEELLSLYSGWDILTFETGQTPIHTDKADDEPHRHSVAVLAAMRR